MFCQAAALIRCIHTQSVLCDKSNAAKALATTNADDASTRGKVLRINKAMEGYLKSMAEHGEDYDLLYNIITFSLSIDS